MDESKDSVKAEPKEKKCVDCLNVLTTKCVGEECYPKGNYKNFVPKPKEVEKKVDPKITITLHENLSCTVETTVGNRLVAFGMLQEAKEMLIEGFMKKAIEKEKVRQKLAGGGAFIPGLKNLFSKGIMK